jgi:predicted glycoside hydrolase/deacetylase ChbG (UPF0249 family)
MLRLIVNADDFGMTSGVTNGIVESMTAGIVSSTSLMVNMASAPEAVALARKHGLAVGMHLNLTTGRPVSPPRDIPSLVRGDGSFHSHAEFRRRLVNLKISIRDMDREFSAQIEAARRMGIEPTHLDTHHHLHLWLPVAWALLRAGRRSGIRKTRTTRTTDMAIRAVRSKTLREWAKRRYKTVAASFLGRWFVLPTWRMEASVFRAKGNDHAHPGLDEWLRLVGQLETLPADHTVEIPCHPGYVDDELRGYARYAEGRHEEILVLTSQELKTALSRAGIRLVTFRDL